MKDIKLLNIKTSSFQKDEPVFFITKIKIDTKK